MRSTDRFRILAAGMAACVAVFLVLAPSVAADSVTRGGTFTVSILGKPATAYYVWLSGTSTMTGEPGDQPPVIADTVENVEFDPDEGPYAIGSYRYYNGNGRTILDDVAPSSDTVSRTRYYAKVTTDSDGLAIIVFRTSSATADRTFTIKAQNPAAPGDEVPVRLGVPARKTTATPAMAIPRTPATLPEATTILPATTPLETVPAVTEISPVQTTTPVSGQTPRAPAGTAIPVAACIAALLFLRKIR